MNVEIFLKGHKKLHMLTLTCEFNVIYLNIIKLNIINLKYN